MASLMVTGKPDQGGKHGGTGGGKGGWPLLPDPAFG
jgi:hypothetical protein